jgi:hypothetical protein
MNRTVFLSTLLIALLLAVGGCRMGGNTGVVDSSLEAGLLTFDLCDGTTTREEVLLLLGVPTAQFERGRLIIHRMLFDGTTKNLFPVASATNERVSANRRLYDLVLVFENDVVCRHTLVRVR